MYTKCSVIQANVYDIAIVGSGLACSMALCQLAERLKRNPAARGTLRIGVIEKEGDAWNGIPYGRRSSIGALAFQNLEEFLDEPERGQYIDWLETNKDTWLRIFREAGGCGAARWISDNQPLIDRGRWRELYLPRFLFGLYVSNRIAHALKELSNSGLGTAILIHGEATEMSRTPDGEHSITVEHGDGAVTRVRASRVVLAIGSPPQRSIYSVGAAAQQQHTHIHDIYSPSEDISIQRIHDALSSTPDKRTSNILIVGSNASALEVLYLVNYRSEIRDLINSVVVLSRSGMLPYPVCGGTAQFELMAMESLCESPCFSASELMAAIALDIQRAREMGVNIADLRNPVGAIVNRAINLMHLTEQEKFVCDHGAQFSRMMRRAGRDTRNAADELAGIGLLTILRGTFIRLESSPSGHGPISVAYAAAEGQGETIHPVPFSITINCGGFEELDVCSSRLLKSVIDNKLCRINRTNRGLLVNDRLEASENVYVIGPLVGGNFNERIRFWHVESASRIVGLAKLLAESLSDSLFSSGEHLASYRTAAAHNVVSNGCLSGL